jgi:L-alanine-DL-glutamate epimerase-like enolase superfamily enzyme
MRIESLSLFRVTLPFRFAFRHHSAARWRTDNLVLRLRLENGVEGVGEGIPRDYVTGETVESAAQKIQYVYAPRLAELDPSRMEEAVSAAAGLPVVKEGRTVFNAARCAVELALVDAYGKAFRREAGRMGGALSDFSLQASRLPSECVRLIPRTAVLPFLRPRRLRALFFLLYGLFGFRQFKLKMGGAGDGEGLAFLENLAPKNIRRNVLIRVDANEAWTVEEALSMVRRLERLGVESVEQPVAKDDLDGMARLTAGAGTVRIIADESLRTEEEAEVLAGRRACHAFQVRLSKCGGLIPSLRIVALARRHGLPCHLGVMVGETGILAAAERLFAECTPDLASAEPSFSPLLLRRDVLRRCRAFRHPAGWWPTSGFGLGLTRSQDNFTKYARPLFEYTLKSNGNR